MRQFFVLEEGHLGSLLVVVVDSLVVGSLVVVGDSLLVDGLVVHRRRNRWLT